MKRLLVAVLAGLFLACGGYKTSHPAPDSPKDDSVTVAEVRYMAERKLVCVRNQSTFPLRVEIRSQSTGKQEAEIYVQPLGYAEEWVERDNFEGGALSFGVIKATGAPKNATPDALNDMQTLPNGRNIEITVGTRKGGLEPFAHSYRAASCGEEERENSNQDFLEQVTMKRGIFVRPRTLQDMTKIE